jgi:hypothetical protein
LKVLVVKREIAAVNLSLGKWSQDSPFEDKTGSCELTNDLCGQGRLIIRRNLHRQVKPEAKFLESQAAL